MTTDYADAGEQEGGLTKRPAAAATACTGGADGAASAQPAGSKWTAYGVRVQGLGTLAVPGNSSSARVRSLVLQSTARDT